MERAFVQHCLVSENVLSKADWLAQKQRVQLSSDAGWLAETAGTAFVQRIDWLATAFV